MIATVSLDFYETYSKCFLKLHYVNPSISPTDWQTFYRSFSVVFPKLQQTRQKTIQNYINLPKILQNLLVQRSYLRNFSQNSQ